VDGQDPIRPQFFVAKQRSAHKTYDMNLLLLAVMNLSVGFLSGVLAIPLITKGIDRNGSYGFRFESSFQSDEAWYAINSYGGKWILFWSFVIFVLGATFLVAYFRDSFQISDGLKVFGVFAPCLLVLSGAQASIWADRHFPKTSAEQNAAGQPATSPESK